jgi:CheY-like chemotaxis protein
MSAPLIPPSLRVLVVEDSPVNQKLLSLLLQSQGCHVTVAANGEEAVNQFALHPFDLVLMDVQMPIMDGLTATRIIRRRETGTGKHAPIIAVTAGFDRDSCLEAGMDEHLQKPIRPKVLFSMLEHVTAASA